MVDDVASISKCGVTSLTDNSDVNSFMEHKKLTLEASKCAKLYVGKKCDLCPELFVYNDTMKDSHKL